MKPSKNIPTKTTTRESGTPTKISLGPINPIAIVDTKKQMTICNLLGVFFRRGGKIMQATKYGPEASKKQYPIFYSDTPYTSSN